MNGLPLFPLEARHEARLILAANPALFSLLTLGHVVHRRASRKVIIPSYGELVITCAPKESRGW